MNTKDLLIKNKDNKTLNHSVEIQIRQGMDLREFEEAISLARSELINLQFVYNPIRVRYESDKIILSSERNRNSFEESCYQKSADEIKIIFSGFSRS